MNEILKSTKQPGDFLYEHFENDNVIHFEELEEDLQLSIN